VFYITAGVTGLGDKEGKIEGVYAVGIRPEGERKLLMASTRMFPSRK
jgi:hypothetical protein